MHPYKTQLPQLGEATFLTDGGLETTLIFHQGMELPLFAAFDLLKSEEGKQVLKKYYLHYLHIARQYKTGFVLEAPTWRANQDWGAKLGYSSASLDLVNKRAIELMEELRKEHGEANLPIVISGCLGPRGDGYVPSNLMNAKEAQDYHTAQVKSFSETTADLVTAMTINYTAEAIGIVRAAQQYKMPVVISFTTETDGKLPNGETLQDAITQVDEVTDLYVAYYMINCAHPNHFKGVLQDGGQWLQRIKGIRANASMKSHAELDESDHLDAGDKQELARGYLTLKSLLPNLTVIGGCCGTDHTHLEKICTHWFN